VKVTVLYQSRGPSLSRLVVLLETNAVLLGTNANAAFERLRLRRFGITAWGAHVFHWSSFPLGENLRNLAFVATTTVTVL